MTDVTAAFHGGNPESVDADASIEQDKARLRRMVIDYVQSCGAFGATCAEVELALGLAHQTASPRVTEARALGLLTRTGERRPTRSGRHAAVYLAVNE
jgi:hypothetical protein